MHVPDGSMSHFTNLAMGSLSVACLTFGVWRLRKETKSQNPVISFLAMIAAFIFAAQMLNFPIGGGTSGHLLGAMLAATLLGPWGACLALALVLSVQGFFFADGGVSALGTNLFNMGVVGGVVVYPLMRRLRDQLPAGQVGFMTAVGVASWTSVVLASAACGIELAISGAAPLSVALPAMVGTHALIGVGEALITVAVVKAVLMVSPDALPAWADVQTSKTFFKNVSNKTLLQSGVALALALVAFVSPFASRFPDGLERVTHDNGFAVVSADKVVWARSLFADYQIAALGDAPLSGVLAGLLGTLLVFATGYGIVCLAGMRRA